MKGHWNVLFPELLVRPQRREPLFGGRATGAAFGSEEFQEMRLVWTTSYRDVRASLRKEVRRDHDSDIQVVADLSSKKTYHLSYSLKH